MPVELISPTVFERTMDLISQEGDTTHIPSEWIGRWQLLSDYSEDTGSNILSLPYPKEQIVKWSQLNISMDAQDEILPVYAKADILDSYRLIRFLNPHDGSWLLHVDISVFSQEERAKLYKELGRWLRRHPNTVRDFDLIRMSDDPAVVITASMSTFCALSTPAVVEGLLEMAYAIPLDILYGIYFSSSIVAIEGKDAIDWKTLPWEDLAVTLEAERETWLNATSAFAMSCSKCSISSSHAGRLTLRPLYSVQPMGYVSNIARFFTKRPLIQSNEYVEDMEVLPSDTEEEVRDYLNLKAKCKLHGRSGIAYMVWHAIDKSVPHFSDFVTLVCDYADEYPTKHTAAVLFNLFNVLHIIGTRFPKFTHNTIGTVGAILGKIVNAEQGSSLEETVSLHVWRIREVLGDRCLRTMVNLTKNLGLGSSNPYAIQFVTACNALP